MCAAHIGDNLIGFWVRRRRRRRRRRRCRRDLRVSAVQILNALLVILAQPQRVREGVVSGHDGPRLAGVLQAQDVSKLMGSNLEKVRACRGCRGEEYHSWLTWWSGVCLEPHLVSSSSPSSAPDCLFQVCALGADLFNFPTKRVWVELERLLSLTLASQPDTHPCGFRGSMTHRSQSGCRPGGVFLGRRREQGSHPGHQRGGCLRANTCRCKSQTRVQTALKQQWRKTTRNTFKTRRRPAARRT